MNDEHRCGQEGCASLQLLRQDFDRHHEEYKNMAAMAERHEKAIAKHDVSFAVINTKLSAILWGVGVIGTALIGVLVKMVFGN